MAFSNTVRVDEDAETFAEVQLDGALDAECVFKDGDGVYRVIIEAIFSPASTSHTYARCT
ncbi:hypothetical protein [Corynebacterium wankanglinii]|uniref:Uncharacterized protein n=1 Tax=Corynebacterium wankanglinii TaxID=2735136 RepID=A0A838CLT5_9CORY|nr:hypothetical protein [Corynebacterium wankanglinii]MBA1836094.1 hypothetical protein [Corynebacterium wankanglinii]